MERPFDAHLSLEEIEQAIAPEESAVKSALPRSDSAPWAEHLATCETCRGRVQAHKAGEAKLAGIKSPTNHVRGAQCPSRQEWLRVAAGLASPEETEKCLHHAMTCDYCGPRLRQATETLSEEMTPEEQSALAQLKSGTTAWQENLAAKMSAAARSASTREESPRGKWMVGWAEWPRWAWAAAAFVMLAVGGWWMVRSFRPTPVGQLLADAYTRQRTLELRIPGARYGPLHQERGGKRSHLDRPIELLAAETEISKGLASRPNDPVLLDAQGRAQLLEWEYEAAMRSFKQAQESESNSPALLTDLASAYFERAENEDRPPDYGTAIELLSQALAKTPDGPVALFNRAIAYEQLHMLNRAIDDWQHYLRVDPQGEWATEAQHHLARLQQEKKGQAAPPLMTDPETFVHSLMPSDAYPRSGRNDEGPSKAAGDFSASREKDIDSRIEDYLDLATTVWLPMAYPFGAAGQNPARDTDARTSLRSLARILRKLHKDSWLGEMISAPPSALFAKGVAALSRAVHANQSGDPSTAEHEAVQAENEFREAGSDAGKFRAEIEAAYAFQRSAQGDRCLRAMDSALAAITERGYSWMHGQGLLEESICRGMLGQLNQSRSLARQAGALSEGANYSTLHLRCLGIAASLETDQGNPMVGWRMDRDGLDFYWAGANPPMRAFQFYSDLTGAAEESRQWFLATALGQEAVEMISATAYRSGEADARFRLATDASMAGEFPLAEGEFEHSNQLFAALPQSAPIQTYEMNGVIGLAKLETMRGNFSRSLALLQNLHPNLTGVADYEIPLDYYQTLGSLYLRRKEYDKAESAFRAVVRVAETGLANLTGESDRQKWQRGMDDAYRGLVRIKLQRDSDPEGALGIWEWRRAATMRSLGTPMAHTEIGHARAAAQLGFGELDVDPPLPKTDPASSYASRLAQETVLSYAEFNDGIEIWAFDDRGIEGKWIDLRPVQLDQVARRFDEWCADPASNLQSLQSDARQLYQWLIAPVEARLTPDRALLIETDGSLADIPFQALMDGGGRYLGATRALAYSPGMEFRLRLRDEARITQDCKALVVGAPAESEEEAINLPPLPEAAQEAHDIFSRFKSARFLTGRQATWQAVENELQDAEVFHFSGHSFASASHSGLLLASADGKEADSRPGAEVLEGTALEKLSMRHCQLAVLSACPTTFELESVADAGSLVATFLAAGVPHVVASSWNVDSTSTAVFMNAFYSALLTGAKVSAALQRAANVLRASPATAHPYYWASFKVFGRG